ncbi:SMEK domain-containing protein [Exiguobacterium sp. AM39-5BH]|uniref:SMEK domain-containing protein n=1 Tax=Exiguobacterium sp. AM39-5BH TaxID=2292355 RepID=UPI000FE1E41E|nr:SMEK domain-containing protein [Exiguobacterium sp. AM39-5BH]RHB46807.1 hypothetical protein DW881_13285 [Exiguobacterium sp. AM39-5BH]
MIKRLEYVEEIMKRLSLLQYYIKFSSNKLGLHNINKACEPFFNGLFNIICDSNFKRSEHVDKKNAAAIDLQDDKLRKSVQITTTGSKSKLWYTIRKFEEEKLYKKYDVLYHFIVGEKHYKPYKTDPYAFSKGDFNIYFSDQKIKGNEYQIIILDLLDLILIIDALDTEKLVLVHDYIAKEITPALQVYKNKYEKYESRDETPFTAESFMNYCNVEFDQKEEVQDDLEKLASLLSSLEKERTRRFLATALHTVEYDGFASTNLIFNPFVVQSDLSLNDVEFEREIKILAGKKLIDLDGLVYDGEYVLEYLDSAQDNLLKQIYQFCITNSRPLDKLILDVDFSVLN